MYRNGEKGIPDPNQDFGTDTKRNDVGMLISHVGDLLVSGTDAFISYIPERLGVSAAWKFLREMGRFTWARKLKKGV